MTTRHLATISMVLDAALSYFAERADCYAGMPNEAMRLHTEIEQAQAALASLRVALVVDNGPDTIPMREMR